MQGDVKKSYDYHDPCDDLVNTWVFIGGKSDYKGILGRIRKHLGNKILRVEPRSGAWPVDIHVDYLFSAYVAQIGVFGRILNLLQRTGGFEFT